MTRSYSREWFDEFRQLETEGKLRRTVKEIAAYEMGLSAERAISYASFGNESAAYVWAKIAASCAIELARIADAEKQTARLTCCCCGESAGKWKQHWNRDTGYGICAKCVTWARSRGETEDEITSLYGTEGKNWGAQ